MSETTATATEAAQATTSAETTTAAAPAAETTTATAATPETTTAAAPSPAFGADGSLGENWWLTLGDEFAPHAADLGKHKNIRSLLVERDYFRKNGVEYPGEGAQPTAIDRFRAVAGVPATPEGYGITAENIKLPEGMEFDTELAAAVSQAAHKTHTPPAAVAAIVGEFNTILAKRAGDAKAAEIAAHKAAQDSLVEAWRGDFANNASTVRHITAKMAELAGIMPDDPLVSSLLADINAHPSLSRIMLKVADLTREDRIQTPGGFGDMKSPAQRIKDITSGVDPVWGKKYTAGSKAEQLEAYEFVKHLREKAAQ